MTIIAQLFDASGRALGWQPWDAVKGAATTVASTVASGASTAAHAVASGASTAAGAVASGASAVVGVVEDAAQWTCSHVMTNSSVQDGAALAAKYGKYIPPNPVIPGQIAMGVGYGIQAAGALCNMAWPPGQAQPVAVQQLIQATQPMLQAQAVKPKAPLTTPRFTFPTGTIQWHDSKTGRWKIAVPWAGAGLGASPEVYYPQVVTSDHPYLTTMSQGALGAVPTTFQIQTVTAATAGVPIVTQAQGEKTTGQRPFYKKPLFWLIAGGVLVTATVGTTMVVRYRRKRVA